VSLPRDDAAIVAWVKTELAALDATPRERNWRRRAIGGTVGSVMAEVPLHTKLDLRVPRTEMRVLREAAERRGIGVRTYLRRAIATCLLCDGWSPESMAYFAEGGLLGPP
jgi:hypothetical protein